MSTATSVSIRPAETRTAGSTTGPCSYAPGIEPPAPTNVTTVRFDFTFATSFPQVLQALDAGSIVENVQLLVTSPFDIGATFSFGTSGAPTLFMTPSDPTLSVPGEYVAAQMNIVNISDFAVANLFGATTGSATLLYDVVM